MSRAKTPEERKKMFNAIIDEWKMTETTYSTFLLFTRDIVIPSLSKVLTQAEIQSLFANIAEIAEISQEMNQKLALVPGNITNNDSSSIQTDTTADADSTTPTIASIIIQMMPKLEAYVQFTREKGPTDELLEQFESKKGFKAAIDQISTSAQAIPLAVSSNPIPLFLCMPTSRIARYGLFLDLLIKNCVDDDEAMQQLKEAKVQLSQLVDKIHTLIRATN